MNIQSSITLIPNDFIDHYMKKADGEFVKIYLFLLRLINQGIYTGPEQLADMLDLTQKDVLRALAYWEKEGLITSSDTPPEPETAPSIKEEASEIPTGFRQTPSKVNASPKELSDSIQGTDLEQTIYMAETYIGHPLSHNELLTFHYIDRQLHFSPELLEYLIEYCVTKGKKSIRYMESVAISWYEQNIDTVKKAKEQSASYTQNVFPIMKAFGISNRNPAPAEINYIKQWNSLGFDSNILVEACNRTMLTTHQASFQYASRILEEWKKQGVHTMKDIAALDKSHRNQKSAVPTQPANPAASKNSANSFHNFEQRSYDYDDLEARLLDVERRS